MGMTIKRKPVLVEDCEIEAPSVNKQNFYNLQRWTNCSILFCDLFLYLRFHFHEKNMSFFIFRIFEIKVFSLILRYNFCFISKGEFEKEDNMLPTIKNGIKFFIQEKLETANLFGIFVH